MNTFNLNCGGAWTKTLMAFSDQCLVTANNTELFS